MRRKKLTRKAKLTSERSMAWQRWTGFRGMTLRDWMELLVVPLALVTIGFLFTAQQDRRQQQIENQRAASDRSIAKQSAQDEALRAYLNQMGELLLNEDLRSSEVGSEVRTLARARTLTVLRGLGPSDKADVVTFLWEAELISDDPIVGNTNVLALNGADLSGAYLKEAFLYQADFAGADLSDANISDAILNGASFDLADLSNANLSGSALRGAYVGRVNLKGANLSGAYLDGATFDTETNLSGADLSGADLSGARGLTEKKIAACASLTGATMPNGQKYEDWLKDREGG